MAYYRRRGRYYRRRRSRPFRRYIRRNFGKIYRGLRKRPVPEIRFRSENHTVAATSGTKGLYLKAAEMPFLDEDVSSTGRTGDKIYVRNMRLRCQINREALRQMGAHLCKFMLVRAGIGVGQSTAPLITDFYFDSTPDEGWWPYVTRNEKRESQFEILRTWTFPDDFKKPVGRTLLEVGDVTSSSSVPLSINAPMRKRVEYVEGTSQPMDGMKLWWVFITHDNVGTVQNIFDENPHSVGTRWIVDMYYQNS